MLDTWHVTCIASWLCLGSVHGGQGCFSCFWANPQACPGYSSLLYSPAAKDIDASAAVARPAQRASAASVDTVWIHWFWRQCPTWALTLTGDWIKSGAEDGFWWCMKVYGSLRVWRVWCVWCVWCDWCVLTRTLLWQYGYVLGCTAWLYVGRLTWGLQYFPEGLKVCIDLQISKTDN